MFALGPVTFTETDARRTLEHFPTLWRWLGEGRDASVLAPLAPALTGDPATDLAAVWHALQAAGPALRAAGQLPATVAGTVDSLHRSDGGVPKQRVDRVEVGFGGVAGDRQATRKHHGRPWQALCVWSGEVIDALRAGGHPIQPGFAGENITVRGLPWADVRPGVRLRLGRVVCDVTAYALPCSQNRAWFAAGDFMAMSHERGPVSRVYAAVVEPGTIAIGDDAVLDP